MLSVTRHRVTPDRCEQFLEQVRLALEALRARPGFRHGTLGRATDDPTLFVLTTAWDDMGSLRRSLSSMEARLAALPVLSTALDEVSAFEPLLDASPAGVTARASDRADDAEDADRGVFRRG